MIEELIKFASAYDASYPQSIQGATESEISRLEKLLGRRLPAPYRDFLARMGRRTGALHDEDTVFTIEMVLRFYERSGEEERSSPFLFIGARNSEPPESYFLDTREEDEAAQPIGIISTGDVASDDTIRFRYPSLQDMLFTSAFKSLRMSQLPHRRVLVPYLVRDEGSRYPRPSVSLQEVEMLLPKLGFQRLPYTSVLNPLYENKDAALWAHHNPIGGGFSLQLVTADPQELKRIATILLDHLPLK